MELRRDSRKVYVRVPEKKEKCANQILISMGAVPVDIEGNEIQTDYPLLTKEDKVNILAPEPSPKESIEDRIYELLSKGTYSSKQIIDALHLHDLSVQKMASMLSKMNNISKTKEGKSMKYSLTSTKRPKQLSLML